MGCSRVNQQFFLALTPSNNAFVLPATVTRRSRVRQRPLSTCLQQPRTVMMAGLPQPVPLRDGGQQQQQQQQQQQRSNNSNHHNNSHNNGDGVGSGRKDTKTLSASRGGGSSSSVRVSWVDVYQSRKRMLAAGKRRRWTEVLDILSHWEEYAPRLDAKTYNVALSALSTCGRWREAIATLDRMNGRSITPDVYSMNSAISACARAGKWHQALSLLAKMEKEGSGVRPDLFSYNGAINAVAKCGRWKHALELLASIEARGLSPDVISFTSTMAACDQAGEWQRALDIMDLMVERNVAPNIVTYGTAISACARGGRWQTALSLLEEIPSRGLALNAHVYGSAVHACVVGGEPSRALALVEEMMESGAVPDAAAFTAAMTAVDGWAAALRLLEVMKREGVLPDVMAYNAALSVIARSGREDVALALLDQMRIDGCSPDLVSFNTAIDACASREKWQEAAQLLEVDMPNAKVKPDVISFTSVIHACAGPNGNWEKAYQLLDEMWRDAKGAKPNKRTYDLVIQSCGHGGEWELAVALLDDMRDLGIKPDVQTFNIATAACGRSGEMLAAETLVASMWRSGVTPNAFTYASLVAACGRAREPRRASEVFDEARYVRGIRPSLQIYGALLSSLADAERWEDVLKYVDRMVADGIMPDAAATNAGVLAAAKLGDGRRALSLLEGEQRQICDDNSGGPRAETGVTTVDEAGVKLACVPSPKVAVSVETGLEPEAGDFGIGGVGVSGSKWTGGGTGWEGITPSLLNTVLHALDSAGEDAAVLEAVKRGRAKGVLVNASVYRCALKACGNLGDYNQANTFLALMVEDTLTPDIVHWNHALRASAAGARWQEARSRLQEMQTLNVTPDVFSYSMALKACSAGLWSGDSWSSKGGWVPEEEIASLPARESRGACERDNGEQEHKAPRCRGRHAVELLRAMENKGIRVCGRSFTLAMAACLEGHRDRRTEGGLENPPEADLHLSAAALSLFDRLVQAGETPTSSTYALALKACARTANKRRASSIFFAALDASVRSSKHDTAGVQPAEAQQAPPLEVRPWHLASAIAAYDAAGDWTGAQELWTEALRRGFSPRSPGFNAAIAAAARSGDTNTAIRLMEKARWLRLELGARAVQCLVRALNSRGEGERAAGLLEYASGGRFVVEGLGGSGPNAKSVL